MQDQHYRQAITPPEQAAWLDAEKYLEMIKS
jgi:hypothetical protein